MLTTAPLLAAALWSGLIILVMVVLSIRVTLARRKHRVSLGDAGELAVPARTFANAAEYAPIGVAALILLAQVGASSLEIHLIGGALLLGRVIHPFGLMIRRAPNAPRAIGMILTWGALIGAAVLLLLAAATPV